MTRYEKMKLSDAEKYSESYRCQITSVQHESSAWERPKLNPDEFIKRHKEQINEQNVKTTNHIESKEGT